MRRIDEPHLEYPFAGTRMPRDFLSREGVEVGRRHVGALMKRMGIEAIYRKPTTTSSTIAATPGTNSSISHGASCPSDCAIGLMGSSQRGVVLTRRFEMREPTMRDRASRVFEGY
jgi:hypothetical protein